MGRIARSAASRNFAAIGKLESLSGKPQVPKWNSTEKSHYQSALIAFSLLYPEFVSPYAERSFHIKPSAESLAVSSSVTEKIRVVPGTGSQLVSAVIPTRSRPGLVVNAVRSALQQTHPRIEVVVIIDGPDPETEASLARIHDARLRVVPLGANVGGSKARNIGVRAARGRWIAFLDDDDEWLPQKIARQLAAAQASETALPVISSKLIARTPTGDFPQPLRSYIPGKPISEYLFYRKSFADGPFAMQTSTLLVPRTLMLSIPFRPGLTRHQDWDWLLRASHHPGVSFHVIPEPLVIFHTEDGRSGVSRALDWEFSLLWGREMRSCFSPRAYSFFVATECIPRAVKRGADASTCARLVGEFLFGGSPTLRSFAWMAVFLSFPQTLRAHLRQLLRRAPWARRATQAAPGTSGAFTPAANLKLTT